MTDDVGYVVDGPKGKTCSECANYAPSPKNPEVGKCMGFDVQASASCNFFERKGDT